MGKRIQEMTISEKEELYKLLIPNLQGDKKFHIHSPLDTNYNCIAWACNYKNKWINPPHGGVQYDGVTYLPNDGFIETEDNSLIAIFRQKGYEICDRLDASLEEGFQKVALYAQNDDNGILQWTHASRQIMNGNERGLWTSKLGDKNDIIHENPFSIEGPDYGKVFCIMKREFK